jgi:hypothetical protein
MSGYAVEMEDEFAQFLQFVWPDHRDVVNMSEQAE